MNRDLLHIASTTLNVSTTYSATSHMMMCMMMTP